MAYTCTASRGRGSLGLEDDVLTFKTPSARVEFPEARTVFLNGRGWIFSGADVHVFSGACDWDHAAPEGPASLGDCVTGLTPAGVFIGDKSSGRVLPSWPLACVQRLSRFSTTFDVVWVDADAPRIYEASFNKSQQDEVLTYLRKHVVHIYDLGPDPFPWASALKSAKKEDWALEDWFAVFDEEDDEEGEEEEDADDEDYVQGTSSSEDDADFAELTDDEVEAADSEVEEPPLKRRRLSS